MPVHKISYKEFSDFLFSLIPTLYFRKCNHEIIGLFLYTPLPFNIVAFLIEIHQLFNMFKFQEPAH